MLRWSRQFGHQDVEVLLHAQDRRHDGGVVTGGARHAERRGGFVDCAKGFGEWMIFWHTLFAEQAGIASIAGARRDFSHRAPLFPAGVFYSQRLSTQPPQT